MVLLFAVFSYCSLSFYTRTFFKNEFENTGGGGGHCYNDLGLRGWVLFIRLLWIRFLTPLHRISWKSHQPAGKENPISSGQWLRDIDCVFLHLDASSQVGGHSESHCPIAVVILVVWLVVMVVEDRSKVILSTTERGFGITGMMTRGRWMDTNYIISRGRSLRQWWHLMLT